MFGKKKEEVAPAIMAADVTVIGEGTQVTGDFTTTEPISIYGKLEGNIESSSSVFVAENGVMCGNGVMQVLDVKGSVEGDIKCLEVAKIAESGKVSGSLATVRLQTEDGSTFDGKLSMIKKESEAKPE